MTEALDQAEREMAAQLRAVLAAIDNGELVASTSMTYRVQGALIAIEALLGDPHGLLDGLDDDSSPEALD